MIFTFPPPGIRVYLLLDQFAYGGNPVARNRNGISPACGNETVPYHQQAVFRTRNITLNQDTAAFFQGYAISRRDFFTLAQLDKNAAPMISVARLNHHR